MRPPDVAARPLLAASLAVLAAGVVVAAVGFEASPTEVRVAAAPDGPAGGAIVPAVSSRPVTIVLDEAVQLVAPPAPTTTAAPTTTTTTAAAPSVVVSPAPATVEPPPPPPPTATTVPPPPAPPAPPAADVDLACERELFDRTNAARAANGLRALAFDGRAHGVARNWARSMSSSQRLAHNPDYGEDLRAAGIDWAIAGENVGRGETDRIFELWMSSPTHRENLLEPAYTAFAVACITDGTQVWVTQNYFG